MSIYQSPRNQYVNAITPLDIIKDFKATFFLFEAIYGMLFISLILLLRVTSDLQLKKIELIIFLTLVLTAGTILTIKIFRVTKLLNQKRIIALPPGIMAGLQFVFNITLTSVIIPIFLWSKCRELQERANRHKKPQPVRDGSAQVSEA